MDQNTKSMIKDLALSKVAPVIKSRHEIEDLKDEINAKQIEIEALRGRLTTKMSEADSDFRSMLELIQMSGVVIASHDSNIQVMDMLSINGPDNDTVTLTFVRDVKTAMQATNNPSPDTYER